MKRPCVLFILVLTLGLGVSFGEQSSDSIRKMEAAGDTAGARTALARAVDSNPHSVTALTAYAEFLERYGDPAAREAYEKLLAAMGGSSDPARTGVIARRLAALDLLAGDSAAAARHLEAYRSATGEAAGLAAGNSKDRPANVPIPGPLRSFARMAAISPDVRTGRHPARAGAQRGHQRIPGLPQQ